jgi:hypothetical protein
MKTHRFATFTWSPFFGDPRNTNAVLEWSFTERNLNMRMRIPFYRLTLAALAVVLMLCLAIGMASQSQVPARSSLVAFWFGGVDPVVLADWQKAGQKSGPADFMELFKPGAPWQQASSQVGAFKISMQFATRSSDADLAALIADLHRRGIGLALAMGMLRNERGCGKGEGYMPMNLPDVAMKRIQRLGGKIDYVAMDEVVFFGHERYWPDKLGPACKDALAELVREVAANVAVIHHYFPQAEIGDVEPITSNQNFDPKQLVKDYLTFADLYRSETGSNLAFFHADIAWRSKNWRPGIAPLKTGIRARGIRFGIIIGGNPDYKDDVSWTRAGLDQLKTLAADPAIAPEDVVIQSWQPLPTRYLPETTPGTSTWMLLQAEKMLH